MGVEDAHLHLVEVNIDLETAAGFNSKFAFGLEKRVIAALRLDPLNTLINRMTPRDSKPISILTRLITGQFWLQAIY